MAFLFAGLAFGFLMGFGLFRAIETRPGAGEAPAATGEIPSPMGPPAATQTVGGGAPMMAEINALKERVVKDPKDLQAWARLANLYQDAGMFEPAASFYQRAIDLAPNDANLLTDAAICYRELKQFDKALELLERAQKADPAHWQSLYNIVVVAGLQMGRIDRAEAALTRLEQIHPDAPNLSQLRAALGKAR
jgi:tetratricopeptide (TPR) repeat protein